MSSASLDQQIVAIDTKFNKIRLPQDPTFRVTYLKRRLQLLGDKTRCVSPCTCCIPRTQDPPGALRNGSYLQTRTQLLRNLAKSHGFNDLQSTKSLSFTSSVGPRSSSSFSTGQRLKSSKLLPRSVSFQDGLLSEAYNFRGFHHVSDLHRAAVTHLMFAHNDNNTLIASSLDGSLSVYRLSSEPPSVELTLKGHSRGVTDFDISVSNELVVSCSMDGSLCLWHLSDGKLLRQVHSTCRQGLASCRFLPGNNNLVVIGSMGGLVQLVNISTGTFPVSGTSTVPGAVLCLAVDQQNDLVWAGTDRATVLSFRTNILQGKLAKGHRIAVTDTSTPRVTSLSYKPSSSSTRACLLVSCGDLLLYRVTDQLGSLRLHRRFPVVHFNLGVRSTFSPLMSSRLGDCAVTAEEDGAVSFFDVSKTERACINKLQAHSCPALAVAFNYSETFLATSDSSGLVIVWKR